MPRPILATSCAIILLSFPLAAWAGGVSVQSDKSSYKGGDIVTVQWSTPSTTYARDWVGIVKKGGAWQDYTGSRSAMWFYTDGSKIGSKTLIAPNVTGDYELAYFINDGYAELGRGSTFTVNAVPLVQPDALSYLPGATISVSWNNPALANAKDWIGIVKKGGGWTSYTGDRSKMWFYTGGNQRGTKTLVAPPVQGDYQIVYFLNDGYSELYRSDAFAVRQPDGSGVVNTCREINAPGTYTLGNDLSAIGATPCISIHDTSAVTLDCGNHSIVGNGSSAIRVENVQDFTISRCTLDDPSTFVLDVSKSMNGKITSNTIKGKVSQVDQSTNMSVSGNTFSSTYQQTYTSSSTISGNIFTLDLSKWLGVENYASALINSAKGSGNKILNNTINGNAKGIVTEHVGADDGIFFEFEDGATVSGNTISNTWDCGIETGGVITNSLIDNNSMSNVGLCGIGGWYWNSWKGNTVQNNTVTNTYNLFHFLRNYGLKQAQWDLPLHILPGEQVVYFKDNNFTNNKLVNPTGDSSYTESSYFYLLPADGLSDSQMVRENNVFRGNDFGTTKSLVLLPFTMVIDGGGNICKSTGESDFPLRCDGGTAPPPPVSIGTTAPGYTRYGQDIIGSWTNSVGANVYDWIALVPTGSSWSSSSALQNYWIWASTNKQTQGGSGAKSGSATFAASVPTGTYQLVYYSNPAGQNGVYKEAARSASFNISPETPGIAIGAKSSLYGIGSAITGWWSNYDGASVTDWIAIVPANTKWIQSGPTSNAWVWATTNTQTRGSAGGQYGGSISIPSTLPSGAYQLVYYLGALDSSGAYIEKARSAVFTISATSSDSTDALRNLANSLTALQSALAALIERMQSN